MVLLIKKGISPLVASILIIVVAVVLIAVVVSWGKSFSLLNLSLTEKSSDKVVLSNFVWQDNLIGNNLFIKNTNTKTDSTIVGYKINSFQDYPFLNTDRNLSTEIVLAKNGFATIPLVCIPENKFSVDLITSENEYINVPVLAKYCDPTECTFITAISAPDDNYLTRSNISTLFTSSNLNTSGDETFLWTSDKDGNLSTDSNFSTSSLSVNTHLITLQVTDFGAVVEKTISIVVNPPLGLTITSPIDNSGYLVGSQVSFISTIDNNYGVYSCFLDSNIDNTLSTACDFNSTSLSVGTHLITLSVTDDLGTLTTTKSIVVKNSFTPSITSPSDAFVSVVENSVNLVGTAINPFESYTCSWDSNIYGDLGAGCNINVSDLNIGTHEITLSITDGLEIQTITSTLIIKDHLVPLILSPTADATSTEGNIVTFVGSATNTNGSYTCSWDSNIYGSLGTGCDLNISDLNLGMHEITLSVTDDLETVVISQINSVIVIVYVDDLTSLVFSDTISGYSFTGATYTYNSLLVLNTSNTVTVTPTGTGTITVNGLQVSSGTPSSAIDLSDGTQKTITVEVSDVDKYARTYTLYLTKIITTGGTITNGSGYRIHRFTSNGTFTSNVSLTAQLLVVGGGGSGGAYNGGGGNAGALYYSSTYSISSDSNSVTVGAGAAINPYLAGLTGGSSAFGTLTRSGGSGGARGPVGRGGNGAGHAGYAYDYGLGYGPAGAGLSYSITGSSVEYARGGQGGQFGVTGTSGTGNGGGGYGENGRAGGSGVVIVRINS